MDRSVTDLLIDVRECEPATNSDLQERWGLHTGSAVADVLQNDLSEYVYRDENKRIRVRDDAPTEPAGTSDWDTTDDSHVPTESDPPNPEQSAAANHAHIETEEQRPGATEGSHSLKTNRDVSPSSVGENASATATPGRDTTNVDAGDSGVTFQTPPAESDPGGPCCESPDYQAVPAGKRFRTADGRVGTTEKGDRYCKSCKAIVELDGTVYP